MRSSTARQVTLLRFDSRDRGGASQAAKTAPAPGIREAGVDAVNCKESSAYSAACIAQVT